MLAQTKAGVLHSSAEIPQAAVPPAGQRGGLGRGGRGLVQCLFSSDNVLLVVLLLLLLLFI